MMPFLNPILLTGMAAVAAPIVIHLLNRSQFQKVAWGAMRFLKVSIEQNQRRLKIENLLLLMLRCLLVMLLAIAMARPVLLSAQAVGVFGGGKITAVIFIDNSYSMSQTDGTTSRFDRAKRAGLDAVAGLPAGSSAALLLASDIVEGVIPEPTFDLNFLKKTIDTARLCDRGSDLLPAFQNAVAILQPKAGRREIYAITDGQLNGFRQMDAITNLLDANKPGINAHVLLNGSSERENLGISDLKAMTEIPAVDQPLKFAVQVTNFGQIDAQSVHVTLRVDTDPPCDEGVIDSLPPGQSRVIPLFARLRSDQYHSVTASLPADHLPADDSRTLAVHAVNSVNVLLVDGSPGGEARDAETFFLRHALVPVSRTEIDRYFIKTKVIAAGEMASQNLEDFSAVALCDVPNIPASSLGALAGYLQRGNALMIFPGPDIDLSFYNQMLAEKWGFLPAEFGPAIGDATQSEKFLTLQHQHFVHPIVDLWNDRAAGDPQAAHFFRICPMHPQSTTPADQPDAGSARVVLSFADDADSPAVMERTWGAGHVVQFSSTASTKWNDLPAHAGLYIPLIRRALGWAMQQQDRALNVAVGDPFVFHPPLEALTQEAVIHRDGATADERFSRPVEFANHLPTLRFTQTNIAGAYSVTLPGKTIKFAAQQQSSTSTLDSESSLVDLAPPDTDKLSHSADVVLAGQSLSQKITQQRGVELWLPLLITALLLATAEPLLAHWFSQPK